MATGKLKFEAGMYHEAAKKGLSLSEWLAWKAMHDSAGEGSQFDWYNPELKTTDGRHLDAFEQALMHFGIKIRGEKASTGEAFFTDPNARVLFPEFLVREFRFAEQEGANELMLSDIVASRVGINSGAYRGEYIDEGQSAEMLEVAEGADLPTVVVKRHEQAISLYKYGAELKMTYEAVRRARLDHLGTFVRKVALDTRRAKVRRAVETLINGDGNSNPAPNRSTANTSIDFSDIVDLVIDFTDGFEPNVLVADKGTVIRDILKLDIFTARDSVATGASFRDRGDWPKPLGKDLRFVENTAVMDKKLLGVDNRFALEEVYEDGSELVETDRLISSQFNVIAFSEVVGFAKLFTSAARTITHA